MTKPVEYLAREELALLQEQRLTALLAEILPGNRFYADKFAEAGFSLRHGGFKLADLSRLPFTTKVELLQDQQSHPPYGQVHTYPVERYCRLNQTSGTLGQPLRWLDTAESWQWMLGCWEQIYHIAGVRAGDRLLFAFSFGPFLGFWTAFDAATRLGCLCLAAGGMSSAARLRFLLENEGTVVLCTPTYALRLAEVAASELGTSKRETRAPISDYRLADCGFRVSKFIVAGEPGGSIPATRHRIEQAWNARVFDHSGMTEIGPLSIECQENPGGLHLLEGDYVAEVIDSHSGTAVAPGQVGELVLTNLGRVGSPLIRYRTGDLVRVDPRPCPCGRTFVRLEGGILGRTDDMIHVRGNNLYPATLEGIIRRFVEVAEYRVEIDRSNPLAQLRIELEPAPGADGKRLGEQVRQAIRDELLFRVEVALVPPGGLPRFEMKARRINHKDAKDTKITQREGN